VTIGRNDPCACGSGKKYKKCCLDQDREKRLAEQNSRLRLDEQIDAGYALIGDDQQTRACDVWLEAWEAVRLRLPVGICTCRDADAALELAVYPCDWFVDLATELLNAGYKDPCYAVAGVKFCETILAQFTAEREHFIRFYSGQLGVFHFLAGHGDEGERVLIELVRDNPDHAGGYAYLSDMLGIARRGEFGDEPIDRPRAIRLLEAALARPVWDAADFDLERRLEDLRADTAQPGESSPTDGDRQGAMDDTHR
jgi:hypothetical protein